MRVALILIATVILTGEARADVFVPADPTSAAKVKVGSESCAASAGDVAVTGVESSRGWIVRVREGGGPWRRLARLESCPELHVAADGTAVIAAGESGTGQISVREPGGTFGAVLTVGGPPTVVVAPGGRVAAAWIDAGDRGANDVLTAIVRGPGGAVTRSVLDRSGFIGRDLISVSQPTIGIDASGTATMVWTRSGQSAARARMARSVAGAAWTALPDLPTGGAPLLGSDLVNLAVSPNGHTLVTWLTADGVQGMLDSEPYGTIAYADGPGSVRPLVTDAGAALVVFGARGGRVSVVERPAGGGWMPPRQISDSLSAQEQNVPEDGAPTDIDATGTLAPDGRAVVAWTADSIIHRGALVAVAGRLGGAWEAPVRLSSPVRWFGGWSFAPGGLRWDEFEDDNRFALLRRGARLVPDAEAPAPDRAAPGVVTRLPTRLPRFTGGRLQLRVPVRCSEACVVRVDFAGEVVVRELEAGRPTTFRIGIVANSLLGRPGRRALSLALLVADRAGNVTRRSQTVLVRVVRRPLRSFKVSEDHDFSMYTKAGNRAMARLVNSLIEGLAAKTIRSERQLRRAYLDGAAAIERTFPQDELDTPVLDEVFVVTEPPFALAGYSAEGVLSG